MESAGLVGDFLSPESTVTTLLSSSGLLRSGLVPEHNTSITYRDKEYESASEALDAYIADFERSRHGGGASSGRLDLSTGRSATPSRPRTALRNKDVLRERLTDRELDFLTLPVSSLRHRGNRDRLSMTTEELLSIPCDGSMPVTHTSAFIQ
ncbi:lung adenoma susceptibility protein 2-like, partial [Centroberyx affinis]|uniref:lung adenoma susceptibility protein 2-like n=1 Tax=Centroberyx affinis TaxID=166261 RepID=UPI003A5BAD31